ncbi:MAG: hypothetical protein R3300_20210, partial [Candidatus Promineifilaceae bacterium]|nr:hypothetical protein [Candidatus Promineifilaceae bacterium]
MPRRLALIVDNCNYRDDALPDLTVKESGSIELARVLADPASGNFDQVDYLADPNRDALREAVGRLFDFRKPYDLLLLCYAGFIWRDDDGDFFLCSAGIKVDDLPGTAVSVEFLSKWMDRSFSRRQILLLDGQLVACDGSPGDRTDLAEALRGKGYWRSVLSVGPVLGYIWQNGRWVGDARLGRLTDTVVQALESG